MALIALTMTAVLALNVQGQETTTPPTSTPVQPPPTTPTKVLPVMTPENQVALEMIGSKDKLRTFAVEQAFNVSVSINTQLPSGNSYAYVRLDEPTDACIESTIRGINNLSVGIVNPKDWVWTWAGVFNADCDQLFSGSKQYTLVGPSTDGSYSMPSDYGDVVLELGDNIPIRISGVESAFVTDLDENGKTQASHSLRVRDGKVYYPRQLAGGNRMLSAYVTNRKKWSTTDDIFVGNWLYWNVGNGGTPIPAVSHDVELTGSIKGITPMTDTDVSVVVPTFGGYGNNQTVELKVTTQFTSKVSFWTTEGKWFSSAWVRKAGTTNWILRAPSLDATRNMISFDLPVQAGVYYIIPIWSEGDLVEPEDPYYEPYYYGDYGEKGEL